VYPSGSPRLDDMFAVRARASVPSASASSIFRSLPTFLLVVVVVVFVFVVAFAGGAALDWAAQSWKRLCFLSHRKVGPELVAAAS
jgi:energy-converting hydrogenase Eha subunit G